MNVTSTSRTEDSADSNFVIIQKPSESSVPFTNLTNTLPTETGGTAAQTVYPYCLLRYILTPRLSILGKCAAIGAWYCKESHHTQPRRWSPHFDYWRRCYTSR